MTLDLLLKKCRLPRKKVKRYYYAIHDSFYCLDKLENPNTIEQITAFGLGIAHSLLRVSSQSDIRERSRLALEVASTYLSSTNLGILAKEYLVRSQEYDKNNPRIRLATRQKSELFRESIMYAQ